MKLVELAGPGKRLSVLCIGAHSDDLEIGAGVTILGRIGRGVRLDVHWAVLSACVDGRDSVERPAFNIFQDTLLPIMTGERRIVAAPANNAALLNLAIPDFAATHEPVEGGRLR